MSRDFAVAHVATSSTVPVGSLASGRARFDAVGAGKSTIVRQLRIGPGQLPTEPLERGELR
jgi:hypothetical protein